MLSPISVHVFLSACQLSTHGCYLYIDYLVECGQVLLHLYSQTWILRRLCTSDCERTKRFVGNFCVFKGGNNVEITQEKWD